MSQFNYVIEYAKGSTHFLADCLSRAIDLPNEAWQPRIPIDNDDDFLSTPFMMFWPGVFHGYRIAALNGAEETEKAMNLPAKFTACVAT